MEISTVIWMFTLVYLLHDLEEIFTVERWMNSNRQLLTKWNARNKFLQRASKSADISTGQFAAAFFVLFLFTSISCFTASQNLHSTIGLGFFMAVIGVMFLHVFTHIGQAVALRRYTPGVVTAGLIVLPYTLWVYREMFDRHLITWPFAVITAICGVVLILPLTFLAHFIGRKTIRRSSR